jgi:hypothetical protein
MTADMSSDPNTNSAVRESLENDAEVKARLNDNRLRYRARKKAGLVPERVPDTMPQKPRESPWFYDWIKLNSEDPAVVAIAKRNCRHRMDIVVSMATKACAADEPKKEKEKEEEPEEGSCGLADEY